MAVKYLDTNLDSSYSDIFVVANTELQLANDSLVRMSCYKTIADYIDKNGTLKGFNVKPIKGSFTESFVDRYFKTFNKCADEIYDLVQNDFLLLKAIMLNKINNANESDDETKEILNKLSEEIKKNNYMLALYYILRLREQEEYANFLNHSNSGRLLYNSILTSPDFNVGFYKDIVMTFIILYSRISYGMPIHAIQYPLSYLVQFIKSYYDDIKGLALSEKDIIDNMNFRIICMIEPDKVINKLESLLNDEEYDLPTVFKEASLSLATINKMLFSGVTE